MAIFAIFSFLGGPKNGQIWFQIQFFCKNPSPYVLIDPYKHFGPFKIFKKGYFDFRSFWNPIFHMILHLVLHYLRFSQKLPET